MAYPYPQFRPVDRRTFIGITSRWRGLQPENPLGRRHDLSEGKGRVMQFHSVGPSQLVWPSGSRGTYRRGMR